MKLTALTLLALLALSSASLQDIVKKSSQYRKGTKGFKLYPAGQLFNLCAFLCVFS